LYPLPPCGGREAGKRGFSSSRLVIVLAWCLRDQGKSADEPTAPKGVWRRPPPLRPLRFIALVTKCVALATASILGFEGERWAWEGQALLIGCAVLGRTYDWRIDHEVLFYPDDLPRAPWQSFGDMSRSERTAAALRRGKKVTQSPIWSGAMSRASSSSS
jgi:hypothetical protein